jgi:hypothetical protein
MSVSAAKPTPNGAQPTSASAVARSAKGALN